MLGRLIVEGVVDLGVVQPLRRKAVLDGMGPIYAGHKLDTEGTLRHTVCDVGLPSCENASLLLFE